jgi:hypothetical protein
VIDLYTNGPWDGTHGRGGGAEVLLKSEREIIQNPSRLACGGGRGARRERRGAPRERETPRERAEPGRDRTSHAPLRGRDEREAGAQGEKKRPHHRHSTTQQTST